MAPVFHPALLIGFAIQAVLIQCAEARSAQLIQSAGLAADRLTSKGSIDLVPDFPFDGPIISVSSESDQEILGFGGAFTEAAALVFKSLPEKQRTKFLEMYFGKDGIGFTLGRSHINSCDFSPGYYTFDDVDGDFGLEHFDSNLTHDQEALIPFIHAAQDVLKGIGKELKIIVAPWSPPGWMKTSGQMLGSDRPGLKNTHKPVWANYISKWISAHKANGINIWALTPQNEPENDGIWESCVYTAEQELDFIAQNLGPVLKAAHPDVEIWIFDHNKDHMYEWALAMYNNSDAMQYVSGIAFHWYTGDEFQNVARVHREFPTAKLLSTEATYDQSRLHGASVADGKWSFGMGYAHEIIGDLNAGAMGFIDWNLILDMKGGPNKVGNNCDAPMVSNGEIFFVHPQYYAMGHFSKYILPGSRRLHSATSGTAGYSGPSRPYGTCDAQDGLEATSFLRPDGLLVVVVLNCGDAVVEFKLQDGSEAIHASIPAQALQTYLVDRAEMDIVV